MIQDSLPRVPIITHGWSSDGSYTHLEELHHECAKDSLPRVHDAVLVGLSTWPSSLEDRSTGYDAPFSGLKREAHLHAIGMATKEIGSTG